MLKIFCFTLLKWLRISNQNKKIETECINEKNINFTDFGVSVMC